MAGEGFEPSKAEPTRLQRVPFDRSGTPPGARQFREVRAARRAAARSGRLAQLLRFGERLQLFERAVLDLADALAGDVERAADFLERACAPTDDAVAHLDDLTLAPRQAGEHAHDVLPAQRLGGDLERRLGGGLPHA